MLKRVEIKNFRSCQDVVLDDLGPMTVLVGRNAVGKTNILRAIQWAADVATSTAAVQAFEGLGALGPIVLEAAIKGTIYRYAVQLQTDIPDIREAKPQFFQTLTESLEYDAADGARHLIARRHNEEVVISGFETHLNIGGATPFMPAIVSLLPPGEISRVNVIREFLSALEGIRYYPLDTDVFETGDDPGILSQKEYNEWLTKFRTIRDPGKSALKRLLHLSLTDDPRYQEICSLLGPDGLGLVNSVRIETLPIEQEDGKWYWFAFRPNPQSESLGFKSLSAGTQRVVRLLVSLIFDQSSVMLVEHPEDSIHRGLLRKLLDVLRTYSDQSQLILSSHSSVVFNTLDPKAIRLVTMEDGNTKVRPLTNDELSAAGKFMEEDGSLSDFIETVEEE